MRKPTMASTTATKIQNRRSPTRNCSANSRRFGNSQWQGAGTPHLTTGPAHGVRVGELEDGERLQEHLEGDAQLHTRQVGTGAAVDAEAEGGVAVVLAVDDHLVRSVEELGVAVG